MNGSVYIRDDNADLDCVRGVREHMAGEKLKLAMDVIFDQMRAYVSN